MENTQTEQWSKLLVDAVNNPGRISSAHSRFWNYSMGNQLLAWSQCYSRGIDLGPIATYKAWQSMGRNVMRGQKAIELCMPITMKRKAKPESAEKPETFSMFVLRKNWFVLSQTDGAEYVPVAMPEWNEDHALAALGMIHVKHEVMNGNALGAAYHGSGKLSVSPLADRPATVLFHEIAHHLLGHTTGDCEIEKPVREVEAECVALIVSECLSLPGAAFSRGYVQHWMRGVRGKAITEAMARRIFKAADQILKAGRPAVDAE